MSADGDIIVADETDIPLWISMVAGCISGAIEATATWPFEYVKTQLQLQERKAPLASLACDDAMMMDVPALCSPKRTRPNGTVQRLDTGSTDGGTVTTVVQVIQQGDGLQKIEAMEPPPYTDMISGIRYTIQTTGFWSLYYGLTPTLLGSIPKAGIRFGMFAWFSNLLRDQTTGDLSIGFCFLAGLAAGAMEALLVVAPVETIKTKCIYLKLPFLQGLQAIWRLEGPRGMFAGFLATVCKQSSNHGLRFVCYYEYKRIVSHDGRYDLTLYQSFIGGMLAGVFSALGNQPFDVLKTRMQGIRAHELYTSTWDCIHQTYMKDGLAGFYTGIVPRLARVIPGQGIIFMSFEGIVLLLVGLSQL